MFNEKSLSFILVTEKAHFFNICTAKKYLNVFFYSLPHNAGIFRYYTENLLQYLTHKQKTASSDSKKETKPTIKSLYSKMNSYEVERICGTSSARDMLDRHNKISSIEF